MTNLDLINGIAPGDPSIICEDQLCFNGGAILVLDHATLVMRHCDVRGQGPVGSGFAVADRGGGIRAQSIRAMSFDNVTFANLCAMQGAVVSIHKQDDRSSTVDFVTAFDNCRFLGNYAIQFAVVWVGDFNNVVYFYDCDFDNNEGSAFMNYQAEPDRTMGFMSRCNFWNNTMSSPDLIKFTGMSSGGGPVTSAGVGSEYTDCWFENNIGITSPGGQGGAVGVFGGSFCTLTNCTFIGNVGYDGGAVAAVQGSMTILRCYFRGNSAVYSAGDFYAENAEITIINSTFTGTSAVNHAGFGHLVDSTLLAEHSVFSDASANYGPALIFTGSTGVVADCIVRDTFCKYNIGAFFLEAGSNVHIARTRVQNNRVPNGPAAVVYAKSSSVTFEDCDIIDNLAKWNAAVFFGRNGGHMTFINSRMIGNTIVGGSTFYSGSVGYVDSASSVRIVGGTIMNASGPEDLVKAAIYDESTVDFGVIMDSVVVDETITIFSNGSNVLLQNCVGFSSTAVAKAEVATCAATSDYCIPESCVDTSVGIDCSCEVDGVEIPFPTDCMQSAVIEARRLSTASARLP